VQVTGFTLSVGFESTSSSSSGSSLGLGLSRPDSLLRKQFECSDRCFAAGQRGCFQEGWCPGFCRCPSSLPCAVRFDPTCLEDTDEDGDELVVRRPLSRLKRSRDGLAPSALESGSRNSEKVFPTDAGSTVGSASTVAAAGSSVKSVGKRRGSAITGKTDTRFDAGNLRPKSTHAFGCTLPGELARYIIAAGVNCPCVFLRDGKDSRVSDVGTAALPDNGGSIPPVESAGLYSGTRKHIRYSGEKAAVHRVSTVHIRYLPHIIGKDCDQMLNQIHAGHCRMVARRYGHGGKARAGKGNLGCMHPVGTHINTKGDMCQYVTSSGCEDLPILRAAVTACSRLAGVAVPGVLRVAQDLEDDAGMQRLPGMDGCDHFGHVTHTLDLSVNLSSASHYDVNDASQGFSIWTEDEPGTTKNWYFVLPNLVGTFPDSDCEYKGIAIKLSHGVLVSWDGRLIRHCTSVKTRHAGNFFGTFFAAKTRVVKFGMRVARERHNAADTSQVETHARQEPEVSPEPAEGKVAAGMSGKNWTLSTTGRTT
jgi:hypothetical protein